VPLGSAEKVTTTVLDALDAWIVQINYEGFGKEVTALGKELSLSQQQQHAGASSGDDDNNDDVQHLQTMLQWHDWAAVIGLSMVWMMLNPITIVALLMWTYASWMMIVHHTCHGGYNHVDAGCYNSCRFALGSVLRRCQDWLIGCNQKRGILNTIDCIIII